MVNIYQVYASRAAEQCRQLYGLELTEIVSSESLMDWFVSGATIEDMLAHYAAKYSLISLQEDW